MPTRRTTRTASGFSLIELLVVITIILVLMALILPAMDGAKDKTREISCMSNLRSLGQASGMFAANHDGYLPGCGRGPPQNETYNQDWMSRPFMGREVFAQGEHIFNNWHGGRVGVLAPYLGIGDPTSNSWNAKDAKRIYRCPQLPPGPTNADRKNIYSNGAFDYAMMQVMAGARLSVVHQKAIVSFGDPNNGGKIEAESRTPYILEESPGWWLNYGANMEPQHGNIDMLGSQHFGSGNYLAADFSVVSFDMPTPIDQPFAREWFGKRHPNGRWHRFGGGSFGTYNRLNN